MVVGHLRGKPANMQANVHFDNVVEDVLSELGSRVAAARTAGCGEVWADPGIGFGKHLESQCACSSSCAPCGHAWACPSWWACRASDSSLI